MYFINAALKQLCVPIKRCKAPSYIKDKPNYGPVAVIVTCPNNPHAAVIS